MPLYRVLVEDWTRLRRASTALFVSSPVELCAGPVADVHPVVAVDFDTVRGTLSGDDPWNESLNASPPESSWPSLRHCPRPLVAHRGNCIERGCDTTPPPIRRSSHRPSQSCWPVSEVVVSVFCFFSIQGGTSAGPNQLPKSTEPTYTHLLLKLTTISRSRRMFLNLSQSSTH